MTAHTRKAKEPLLDSRIDILNRNAVEVPPANQVFGTVSAILALVRDEMADDEDSVQLSEYCFNVCEVLKTVIRGRGLGDLDESVRTALRDLERVICKIERTLRRGTSIPHIKYNKGKVEGYKLEIQVILRTGECAPHSALVSPHNPATTSVSETACARLIGRAFAPHELPTLIEVVSSNKDEGDTVRCLLRDDAQTLVDVIDEALDKPDLLPWTRKKCLRLLYRTCGHHALLPRTLKIPVCYDRTGIALYRGGFADVWKGEYCGRDVAVKVIRTYSKSDLQKIIGRFCKEVVTWKSLRHPNVLPLIGVTMSEVQFAMVSDWMVNGNVNDFVKAHPDANRLELLGGVARGLIYIHSQGMIHGDLKGANILIDQACRVRLADFGLLTIISDPKNLSSSSSYAQGGTARWMSPELIAPQRFGLKNNRPTKHSDCYALGMVIYETISGHLPFHRDADLSVFVNVLAGDRPSRGAGFPDSLWRMLGLCWASQPNNRPSIEDVLQCLETISNLPESYSPGVDEETESSDGWDSADGSADVSHDHDADNNFPASSSNFFVNSVDYNAYLDMNRETGTTDATPTSLTPSPSSMPFHAKDEPRTNHQTNGRPPLQINSEALSVAAAAASTDPLHDRSTELRGNLVEEVTADQTPLNTISKTTPRTSDSDDRAIDPGYERGIGKSVRRELPSPPTPSSSRYSVSPVSSPGSIASPVDRGSAESTARGQRGHLLTGDFAGNSTVTQVPSESTPTPMRTKRPLPRPPTPAPTRQVHSHASPQPLPMPPYPLPSSDVLPITTPTTASMPASHMIGDNTGSTAGTLQKTLQSDRRKALPRLVVNLGPPPSGGPPRPTAKPPSPFSEHPNNWTSVSNGDSRPSVLPTSAEPSSKLKRTFKWVRGELIGKGTYSNVYIALNATTGEMIAVKQVEIPRTENDRNDSRRVTVVEALKLENETLKDLDHPNVVQYLGFEETPRYLSIFLEYVPGGSIGSILRKLGWFDGNVTKSFAAQILDGLDYLHSNGIIHRDLRADNILVEEFGLCKITDFGISKRMEDINMIFAHTPMQGSAFWMAPEVINSKKGYNSKVDIWGVGCVMFEVWTGERPWSGQEAAAVLLQVSRSKLGPLLPEGVVLSSQADDFRKRCFAMNPEERPTAGELRQHPYLVLPPGWEFRGFQ